MSHSNIYNLFQEEGKTSLLTIQSNSKMEVCNQIHAYIFSRHGTQTLEWRLSIEDILQTSKKSFPEIQKFVIKDSDKKDALYLLQLTF